jgi:hypothetical protein
MYQMLPKRQKKNIPNMGAAANLGLPSKKFGPVGWEEIENKPTEIMCFFSHQFEKLAFFVSNSQFTSLKRRFVKK